MRKNITIVMLLMLLFSHSVSTAGLNEDLIQAIINGGAHDVRVLLERGASIDTRDRYGKTALMWAVIKEKKDIVGLLLERGADINAKDWENTTALIWATVTENAVIVKELIEKGADISIKDSYGKTAFTIAKERGTPEIARMITNADNLK